MKNLKLITSAISSVLLFSSAASAGNKEGSFTISPTFGRAIYDSDRKIDNSNFLGLAVGYNITNQWAAEIFAGFGRTDVTATKHNADTTFANVNAVYRFLPENPFNPFVTAGIGISHFDPNGEDAKTQPAINGGLGAQYFINNAIALRAEVRDFFTPRGSHNDILWNLGVTFQIDSQKPKSTNSQCAVGRRIATINFANNSSQVTISEQNDLNKIAQCLESNPAYGARLNGHASKVGRQQHNLNLSKQRSENVKKELVSKYGVKSKQLSTAGYGDAQQIADNSTEAGQSKNRRVEAVITQ